ncbi:MAG: zinc ribbon protein [Verrucomicrobiales bacterium]|nr:zinc ribbon protein [Verrucomicrobiales bacterium]
MSEVIAQEKFHCPNCGADAHWNPSKQALVCPYCGTFSPAKRSDAGVVVERDLADALRNAGGDERGWQAEKTSVKCQSCEAITVFDPEKVAQRCPFCGSAQLVPYDQIKAPIRPESLLPLKIPESEVRDRVREWYGNRWFAPNALGARAMTDVVKGIYLPYWTFDAQAHADWTAESGYYYYETEHYADSEGRSQTREVQHTRWEFSAGQLDHFFDDDLVPGTRGVPLPLLAKIEPFPTTTDLMPYDPSFLAGWVVEQYQVDLSQAAELNRQHMDSTLESLCAQQVPGDTRRNLQVSAEYQTRSFKHVLVPVWLLSFDYGAKHYQVLVNGFTGKVAGKYPLSWVKISLAVFFGLVAMIIIIALMNSRR